MNDPLKTTLDLLGHINNEAAVEVLTGILDGPESPLQIPALKAMLVRRDPVAPVELLRRWHTMDESWRQVIADHGIRLERAIRDAILGTDEQLCMNAFDAAITVADYDLIPVLITLAEDTGNPRSDLGATAILSLTEKLHDEIAGPRDYSNRRNPQIIRVRVCGSLEKSVPRFKRHHRLEILEAFLLVTARDNSTLKQILQNPHDPLFLKLTEMLQESMRPGIMRLLASFLDDTHAPSSALKTLAFRRDVPFLRQYFKMLHGNFTQNVRRNLKRIEVFNWVRDDLSVLYAMDVEEQAAAVMAINLSGIPADDKFKVVSLMLDRGNVGGRREAARALARFHNAQANELAMKALRDADPEVEAAIVAQLRSRHLPDAMSILIDKLDSEHEVVRDAAREGLAEFNFARYLSAFDMLDDEVRHNTGRLVKKVDPETVPGLAKELASGSQPRRTRALEIAVVIDAVEELEEEIIDMIKSDNHVTRCEAARTLARCNTEATRLALREALLDSSGPVQEAAENSLQALAELTSLAADEFPIDLKMLAASGSEEDVEQLPAGGEPRIREEMAP